MHHPIPSPRVLQIKRSLVIRLKFQIFYGVARISYENTALSVVCREDPIPQDVVYARQRHVYIHF